VIQELATGGILRRPNPDNPGGSVAGYAGAVLTASGLISTVQRFSPLKSWAVRLAGRKGFRKAAVAAARKIAVLMLTLWKSGTDFRWTAQPA